MVKNVKLGQLEDIGIWKHVDQADKAMCVVRDAVAQILYGESEDDVIVEARADLETLLEQR